MKYEFISRLTIRQRSYLVLSFLCIFLYGFNLLPSALYGPHFIGGNDFKAHAHFILRFFESFNAGQIIPRTIVDPEIFNDAAFATFDAPTFQYYGFFEGLAGLPFQFIKFSPAISAVLAVILIRILCSFALYEACILLNATPLLAILVNLSFLLSPYTMSCFYSRGALAESLAHSLLVLLIYGFILSSREKYRSAILVYTLAVVCLSLCHNIFLLYGLTLLGFLLIFSFSIKGMLAGGIGCILGLLLTIWQWLPSKETINETVFGFIMSWKIPDVLLTETRSASWSGAIGFPEPFTTSWNGIFQSYNHFFTIGIWTIPFILLLVFTPKINRKIALPILMASALFICLTFDPMSTYVFGNFLPGIFNVVQNSYRLLAFVSLLSAVSIAVALPRLNGKIIIILAVLIFASQGALMWKYMGLINEDRVGINEILGSPINAYYSTPINTRQIRTETGLLPADNLFTLSSTQANEFSIRIVGRTDLPSPDYYPEILIASISADHPTQLTEITNPIHINNNFDITFDSIPRASDSNSYRIIARDRISRTPINVVPQGFFLYEGDKTRFITEQNIVRVIAGPYTRRFELKPEMRTANPLSQMGEWIFELPIVYSPLFVASQNGVPLKTFTDSNHRMRVIATTLEGPIIVKYHFSLKIVVLTLLGIIGLLIVYFWNSLYSLYRAKYIGQSIS